MIDLTILNSWDVAVARAELVRCCGSRRWVDAMIQRRPFATIEELFEASDDIWLGLSSEDWLEAFSHHPKIGGKDSLRAKFASTKQWSTGEQAGVQLASDEVLDKLTEGNDAYEKKFGYIFIVCATGKSADEMLSLLQARLGNDPDTEIHLAMGEQGKITRIRLEKLLS
jgi:2-oxo-4-hydroxy-4-carboxy-5-ureidoimidazoline decarboxylase